MKYECRCHKGGRTAYKCLQFKHKLYAAKGHKRRSKRVSKTPEWYVNLKFTPGANNGYTAGREIDPYDRHYKGPEGKGRKAYDQL